MNKKYRILCSESCEIQWNNSFCSISKIGGAIGFSVALPKPYIFYATRFLYIVMKI